MRRRSIVAVVLALLLCIVIHWLKYDENARNQRVLNGSSAYSFSPNADKYIVWSYRDDYFEIRTWDSDETIYGAAINADFIKEYRFEDAFLGDYSEYYNRIGNPVTMRGPVGRGSLYRNEIMAADWVDDSTVRLIVYVKVIYENYISDASVVVGPVPVVVHFNIIEGVVDRVFRLDSWKHRYALVSCFITNSKSAYILLFRSVEESQIGIIRMLDEYGKTTEEEALSLRRSMPLGMPPAAMNLEDNVFILYDSCIMDIHIREEGKRGYTKVKETDANKIILSTPANNVLYYKERGQSDVGIYAQSDEGTEMCLSNFTRQDLVTALINEKGRKIRKYYRKDGKWITLESAY